MDIKGNVDALIAQTKKTFAKYDTAGLVDEDDLYKEIIQSLKAFGNDICYQQEDVLTLKDGRVDLPHNFFKLSLAMMCAPERCDRGGIEYHTLIGLGFIQNEKQIRDRWNECSDCCHDVTDEYVRKEVYFKNSVAKFDYRKGKYLKLSKSFDRKHCLDGYRRMYDDCDKDEITIINGELRANFQDGDIYIRYNGFPVDKEGSLEIPESPNGYLERYLELRLKIATAEMIIANGENVAGLMSLYSPWKQEERVARHNAQTEVKSNNLNWKRLGNKIAQQDNKIVNAYTVIGRRR